MILFDASKCVSCNSCIRACPTPEANKAVVTDDGRTIYDIDPQKCIRCGACVKDCPMVRAPLRTIRLLSGRI